MHTSRRLLVSTIGLVVIALGLARPAEADIIVVNGVNNQGTDNVLLNPANDVLTVTGIVGADEDLVNFTSTSGSGLLDADPSGQATVSGGAGNVDFTQLSFSLADNDTFTRAVFNINAATNGSTIIHVEGVNITGGFFEDDFTVDANGQNFFTVTAINGQLMDLISLTAINGAIFEDVRQVRLGGDSIAPTPIPEPASLLLFGTGLAAFAARYRRKLR